jgi:hypothetical protein
MYLSSAAASVYGPDCELIEDGVSDGPSNGYADTVRFSNPGGDYPEGSYAALGDGRVCEIEDTSVRVESCSGGEGRFLWKPKADSNSKLVILYGSGTEEYTQIGGLVTRVTACTESGCSEDLTEVEIEPCGSSPSALRYEASSDGETPPAESFSGNIFITLKNGETEVPKVGDAILASVVPDEDGVCSELEDGVTPSTYSYEGIVTGDYSISNEGCPTSEGGEGSDDDNSDWGFDWGIIRINQDGIGVLWDGYSVSWGGDDGYGFTYFWGVDVDTHGASFFGIDLW